MDLTQYRSQFDIHFLVSSNDVYRMAVEMLREKGHIVYFSDDEKKFFEEFKKKPSHLVIIDITQISSFFEDFLADCIEVAPQTQFIAIGKNSYRTTLKEYKEHGLLDFIDINENFISVLDWNIDSALERVILKLQNKSLMKTVSDNESHEKYLQSEIDRHIKIENQLKFDLSEEEDFSNLLISYESSKTREDVLQNFFQSLKEYYQDGTKILFFKYLEPIHLLVATHCSGIPLDHIKGAGVKLSSEEARDPKNFLLRPKGFNSLSILMRDVFNVDEYYCKSLVVREEIDGIFVFFGDNLSSLNSIRFNNKLNIFKTSYERFVYLKKLLELEVEDSLENFYSFDEFEALLSEQLDSLQRVRSSLSLVKISIDKLQHHEEKSGPSAVDSLMRFLVIVIKKIVKPSDKLYRTAMNEFTLVLPHTKANEVTITCEKIRRFVQNAEIPALNEKATISMGVSVYPHLAKSTEQLLKSSIQALSTVMSRGGNKVGVARLIQHGKTDKSDHIEGSADI